MRVLWIVNTIFPPPAKALGLSTGVSGGWMLDFAYQLPQNGIELAVASFYNGDTVVQTAIDGITYFLLPGGSKRMMFYHKDNERLWAEVVHSFHPQLVHIHGTEYTHGLAFLRAYGEIPAVVSVQGVLKRIAEVYDGGLTMKELVKFRTLKEYLHLNGTIEQKLLMKKNAKYEHELLNRVKYAHVINTWDCSVTKQINDRLQIFKHDFNLRPEFYTAEKWDYDNCRPYSILTGQCSTPLKGLHMLLKAVAIVKKQLPQITLTVTGATPDSGYMRYIISLIDSLGLKGQVEFAGPKSGADMIKLMKTANTVVVPSAIEGTSMFLREAMFLGVPSVSSFRGGMADYIKDGINGFVYDYAEYPFLAQRLTELLTNKEMQKSFSDWAIIQSELHHDRQKNLTATLSMYQEIENKNYGKDGF
ncbi:MAG: hypothetical protein BGN88_02710 [Clostridiales bacterium 43-6]|nr:MAG: hypothetical protein BGN88_02710 [Clostridiales bacterium 43-6]